MDTRIRVHMPTMTLLVHPDEFSTERDGAELWRRNWMTELRRRPRDKYIRRRCWQWHQVCAAFRAADPTA